MLVPVLHLAIQRQVFTPSCAGSSVGQALIGFDETNSIHIVQHSIMNSTVTTS